MELTVLGRSGGFPAEGGACSGYLLTDGETHIALDLGCGTLPRLRELLPLKAVDALLLSHLHFDHCSDALTLQYALEYARAHGTRQGALPVYLPDTPAAHRALFDNERAFSTHAVRDGMEIRVGSIKARFFAVRHAVETYGMRITGADGRTLVYTGDTGLFPGLIDAARGADALLADTAFFAAEDTGAEMPHMTTAQAARLAREAGVGTMYCTHIHDGVETERKIAAEIDFTPAFVVKELGRYTI